MTLADYLYYRRPISRVVGHATPLTISEIIYVSHTIGVALDYCNQHSILHRSNPSTDHLTHLFIFFPFLTFICISISEAKVGFLGLHCHIDCNPSSVIIGDGLLIVN
jgi:hypothetical protein